MPEGDARAVLDAKVPAAGAGRGFLYDACYFEALSSKAARGSSAVAAIDPSSGLLKSMDA